MNKINIRSHKRLILIILPIILILVGVGIWKMQHVPSEPGIQATAQDKLIAHYSPGDCYGMPGPTISLDSGEEVVGPRLKITPSAQGWNYTISDGNCCDITDYEGTISKEYKIIESSKKSYKTAC